MSIAVGFGFLFIYKWVRCAIRITISSPKKKERNHVMLSVVHNMSEWCNNFYPHFISSCSLFSSYSDLVERRDKLQQLNANIKIFLLKSRAFNESEVYVCVKRSVSESVRVTFMLIGWNRKRKMLLALNCEHEKKSKSKKQVMSYTDFWFVSHKAHAITYVKRILWKVNQLMHAVPSKGCTHKMRVFSII